MQKTLAIHSLSRRPLTQINKKQVVPANNNYKGCHFCKRLANFFNDVQWYALNWHGFKNAVLSVDASGSRQLSADANADKITRTNLNHRRTNGRKKTHLNIWHRITFCNLHFEKRHQFRCAQTGQFFVPIKISFGLLRAYLRSFNYLCTLRQL